MSDSIVPIETIERRILTIRGHKVMLDADLAYIYGVSTKRLNNRSSGIESVFLMISCFS
jgi:hypothetical protein